MESQSIQPSFCVVIQAGGKSKRMGQDKALVSFLGRPMINRIISRVLPITDEILITTNHPEDYQFLKLPLICDVIPDRGALGGLYTALTAANTSLVAVLACDMPFASAKILTFACNLLQNGCHAAVIPKTETGLEPFHAVYRREACLPAVMNAINHNHWRVDSWFSEVDIRLISTQEITRLDPDNIAFWNVNTPEDLHKATLFSANGSQADVA